MRENVKVDDRSGEDVLKQAMAISPFYTRLWDTTDERDSGVVLLKLFSEMVGDVLKRLNQVPEKNFIAFLDMLGLSLNPPQPSRAPLTFTVSEGADKEVYVPEKTQAVADATETRPELTFEVESGKGFLATPSELKKVYSIYPEMDEIFEHLEVLEQNGKTELFTNSGENLQEHVLYIAHGDLFNIEGEAKIKIDLGSAKLDSSIVDWEYYGERVVKKNGEETRQEGWHAFSLVEGDETSEDLSPVINVRGIGRIYNSRLKDEKITTIGKLLKLTPSQLAKIIKTGTRRAANILEAARKGLIDKEPLPSSTTPSTPKLPETPGGSAVLWKKDKGEIKEHKVSDLRSRWIRCRVKKLDSLTESELDAVKKKLGLKVGSSIRDITAKLSEVLITSITVAVSAAEGEGKPPDMAFYNDVPLDVSDISTPNPLYPFGEIPRIYDSFYIACRDAFSKKGSKVKIVLNVSKGSPSDKLMLSWEYWNGQGWTVIEGLKDETNNFKSSTKDKNVRFTCPMDFETTEVGGHENYWIRVRMVAGNYGEVKFKKVSSGNTEESWEIDTAQVQAPLFTKFLIAYEESARVPEHIITLNNRDHSEDMVEEGVVKPFRPFEKLEEKEQCLYLGFDKELKGGPINIFFSIKERKYPEEFTPRFIWECRTDASADRWSRIDVVDETESLTKRGVLSLVAPHSMSRFKRFGEELYWIRARQVGEKFEPEPGPGVTQGSDSESEHPPITKSIPEARPWEKTLTFDCAADKTVKYPPVLIGIHVNTTWVSQAETLRDEVLGSSDGTPDQVFLFSKRPVVDAEIWVNEFSSLSDRERRELVEKSPQMVNEVRDEEGNTTEFWVKWGRVEDFLTSGPGDRHYVLDATLGRVRFGNGVNGKVPPIGTDNIKTNYQSGGGSAGNVRAGEIATLKSSLSFIDGVSNPESADGGTDIETLDGLFMRGPQGIKNRGRAVTREDFEWMARGASRKVARVKCLPCLDEDYNYKPGWVTLIIVPQSREDKPVPSVMLKELVKRHVEKLTSGTLTIPGRLVVKGPCYLKLSVSATLVARSVDKVSEIEKEASQMVREFLHPLRGGYEKKGWSFGRLPCLSDFYKILEEVDGVDHVKDLVMKISGEREDQKIVITPKNGSHPHVEPYNLVFSGDHEITAAI